jgi:thiol-disulfide isomerase/thioredoxin
MSNPPPNPPPPPEENEASSSGPPWLALTILALGVFSAFALAWPSSTPTAPPTAPPRAAAMATGREAMRTEPTEPEYASVLAPGTQAPDFAVERLEGGTLRLSELRGRVVLLDFWATWCPPCRAELPWLVPLARRYESRGVVFVAMSQDNPDGQRLEVSRFASQLPGFSRFAALGTYEVGRDFGAEALPTLYVIDRSGRIAATKVGATEEPEVARALERALSMNP